MTAHHARKRFGQNFLVDSNAIARIIDLIDPEPEDALVEIGPGLGAITRPLLERASRVTAVELDRDLPKKLRQHCAGAGELVLHQADALRFDFRQLVSDRRLRIVGNLPYNISTPLLFHLFKTLDAIEDMHFTLQKEVVERLAAEPSSKQYGRLTVMAQYHCTVDYLFDLPPGVFRPVPKVDSAFVRLTPHRDDIPLRADDPALFARLVAQAFNQRRKTLRNTLRSLVDEPIFAAAEIDPGARAETLAVEDFVRLSNAAAHAQSND